jgi:hypothetical protein
MKLLETLGLKINLINEQGFGTLFKGASRESIVLALRNSIKTSIDDVIRKAGRGKLVTSEMIKATKGYKDALIKGVNELSQVKHGKVFTELTESEQNAVIRSVADAAEVEMSQYSKSVGKELKGDLNVATKTTKDAAKTGTKAELKQATKEQTAITQKMNNGVKELDRSIKKIPTPTLEEFKNLAKKNSKSGKTNPNVVPKTKKGLSYYYDWATKTFAPLIPGRSIKRIVISNLMVKTLGAIGVVGAGIYLLYQMFGLLGEDSVITDEDGNLIDPDQVSDKSLLNCINNLIKNGAELRDDEGVPFLLLVTTGDPQYDNKGGLKFYFNGDVKVGDNSKTGKWSCSLSGEVSQEIQEQGTTGGLTLKQMSDVISSLDDQLSGDFFEGDSTDMKDALDIVKSISGKKYKGEDAISVLKKQYKRIAGNDLIDDVKTKLKPSDFVGLDAQDELLGLLGGSSSSSDNSKKGNALDGISIDWSEGGEGGEGGVVVSPRRQPKFYNCEDIPLPHKFGCVSTKIKDVQKCIGVKDDRYFGIDTRKALMDLEYDVTNGLTQEIYDKIMNNCGGSSEPTKIDRINTEPISGGLKLTPIATIDTSNLKLSDKNFSRPVESGESFYKRLLEGGYFDGHELGKNRIKYKGAPIGKGDFEKLTKFFDENGYYHMKTKDKGDENFKYVWKKY